MLNTVADLQPEREVTFVHAAANGKVHALKDEVAATAEKAKVNAFVFYDAPTEEDRLNNSFDAEGYVTKEWLQENVNLEEADFYFCGPVPFMKSINASLKELGVSEDRIHFEFFGPMASLEA